MYETIQKYKISYVKEDTTLPKKSIQHPDHILPFCTKLIADSPLEQFLIISMNAANSIIGYTIFQGESTACPIPLQNVFRFLLSSGAASFIIAHNHPAGTLQPSDADWRITKRIKTITQELSIKLLDHLIITEYDSISLRSMPKW